MQNDFVNLVDSLYGSTENGPPVIMPGVPLQMTPLQMTPTNNSSNTTIKYVVLGIIFLAFVYIIVKAMKQNHQISEPPVVTTTTKFVEKKEELPPVASPWTTTWTPEPEEFIVSGPLPYSETEEERQFSKISADGNDTNLENYMKKREDFSKK